MLKKRKLANNKYSVTFSMPASEGITELYLVGEFNNWSPKDTPMQKGKDGLWSVKLTLEGGKDYQYRYCDDKGVWYNDWEPDAYIRNDYGADNCLITLMNGASSPAKNSAARKKKAL